MRIKRYTNDDEMTRATYPMMVTIISKETYFQDMQGSWVDKFVSKRTNAYNSLQWPTPKQSSCWKIEPDNRGNINQEGCE